MEKVAKLIREFIEAEPMLLDGIERGILGTDTISLLVTCFGMLGLQGYPHPRVRLGQTMAMTWGTCACLSSSDLLPKPKKPKHMRPP